VYEEAKLIRQEVTMAIQVNGKLRTSLIVALDIEEESLKQKVLEDEIVQKFVGMAPIKRWIIVKNKIVNIVI
ncbi:MAG TPA: hypothetical protein DCM23_01650, partial [Firmicutes bacterium]|nr:hypothetical protein [Bacillota bacterium]